MTRKQLIAKLDEVVRKQAQKPRCEVCNEHYTEVHHYIGRANFNLRWNIRNLFSLCKTCHELAKGSKSDWLKKAMWNKRRADLIYCDNLSQEPAKPFKKYQLKDMLTWL